MSPPSCRYRYILIGPAYRGDQASIGGTTVSFELLRDYLIQQGYPCFFIKTNRFGNSVAPILNALRVFWSLIKKIKWADWIMLHASPRGVVMFSPALYLIARCYGKKWAIRVFGGDFDAYIVKGPIFRKWLFHKVINRSNIMFLQTNALTTQMNSLHPHIEWMPTSRILPVLEASNKNYLKRFVYVGQLHERKGIDLLIQLAEHLPEDYSLHLYGPILDEKYAFLSSSKFYMGTLTPSDVKDIWKSYDVLLFPSNHPGEGYPGVVIEALSHGLPVIAYNWLSLPELITDGRNGFLLTSLEPSVWMQKILMMNEMVIEALSKHAIHDVKTFSLEAVTAKMISAMESYPDDSSRS